MKKIITLALTVVMCLSIMTSVTAASNLNRVASTIPGTDIEYNYIENVTIQIPGTEIRLELAGVYEKAGIVYEDNIPVYRFAFLEYDLGTVKFLEETEFLRMRTGSLLYDETNNSYNWECGVGGAWLAAGGVCGPYSELQYGEFSTGFPSSEKEIAVYMLEYEITEKSIESENLSENNNSTVTSTTSGGTSGSGDDYSSEPDMIAKVEFYWGTGGINESENKFWPDDLISYKDGEVEQLTSQYSDIEKIDITLLDINYEESKDYSIISGANSLVNSNMLTIKADGDFDKFTGVKVDGEFIDSSNYTATEGSTVIDFKADYLKTLDTGEHTVSVVFTDGEAITKFEIAEDKNTDGLVTDVEIPNTDYKTSVVAAFVAMAISGAAFIGLKKKK